jgi:hypothetical protein
MREAEKHTRGFRRAAPAVVAAGRGARGEVNPTYDTAERRGRVRTRVERTSFSRTASRKRMRTRASARAAPSALSALGMSQLDRQIDPPAPILDFLAFISTKHDGSRYYDDCPLFL